MRSSSILVLEGICMVELGHMSWSLKGGNRTGGYPGIPFLYLRSSLIGGHLIWNKFIVYFGHMSLSLKLKNIGPVVAAIFHFWYLRSSFIICIIWGHRSLSLNFGEDWTSGYWDILFLIYEVFFHYFIGVPLHLKL